MMGTSLPHTTAQARRLAPTEGRGVRHCRLPADQSAHYFFMGQLFEVSRELITEHVFFHIHLL
jgi:hypothetical protein